MLSTGQVLLDELLSSMDRERKENAQLASIEESKTKTTGVLGPLFGTLTCFEDNADLNDRIDTIYDTLNVEKSGGLKFEDLNAGLALLPGAMHLTQDEWFAFLTQNGAHLNDCGEVDKMQFRDMLKGELWRFIVGQTALAGSPESMLLVLRMVDARMTHQLLHIQHLFGQQGVQHKSAAPDGEGADPCAERGLQTKIAELLQRQSDLVAQMERHGSILEQHVASGGLGVKTREDQAVVGAGAPAPTSSLGHQTAQGNGDDAGRGGSADTALELSARRKVPRVLPSIPRQNAGLFGRARPNGDMRADGEGGREGDGGVSAGQTTRAEPATSQGDGWTNRTGHVEDVGVETSRKSPVPPLRLSVLPSHMISHASENVLQPLSVGPICATPMTSSEGTAQERHGWRPREPTPVSAKVRLQASPTPSMADRRSAAVAAAGILFLRC